jgi:glucokinase
MSFPDHAAKASILVFDVGGSHISCCEFSLSDAGAGAVCEAPIPEPCGLEEFLATIESLGRRALASGSLPGGASFAMPGPFDYTLGISSMKHKFQGLYGVPLATRLGACLGCPAERVSFLNDAAAFLIGEVSKGAAAGSRRAIGITLGTGVGSAFAVDGQVVVTGEGVPKGGEIWDFPYRGGIVEDLISTAALQRSYERRTGRRAEVRAIATLAEAEREARETFEDFGRDLGQALRDTCAAFHPDCIVLGGGIARSARLFLPAAEKVLEGLSIRICVSSLGSYAPLIGAGVHWRNARSGRVHAPGAEPFPTAGSTSP